jgi:hypothetical protein
MTFEDHKVCSHLMEKIEGTLLDQNLITGPRQSLQDTQWQMLVRRSDALCRSVLGTE